MLTLQLQKSLDEKWNNCWPASDLRPLALLDLISYIFFIKKLDDWEVLPQKVKFTDDDNFIYTREIEEFTWSNLQKLEAREIQQLFNKEHGIINLMANYAHSDSLYSDYFKAPLLIEPTPKLIFNTIEIINIIETSDKITQEAITEFLFSKSKETAQNGQEFIPEYVSKLMVSLASPSEIDLITDPCAGNGSLLINAQRFIKSRVNPAPQQSINEYKESNLAGMESDLVLLRVAAMNMVLHGIKNPNIHIGPFKNENLKNNPTLVISALMFSNNSLHTVENQPEIFKLEKESFLLKEILEKLNNNGRAIILVPQSLLKSDNPEIIKARKKIVDYFNLQAIITLPQKNDSLFSGAGILVFDTSKETSGNVWFCKWGTGKKKNQNNEAGNNSGKNESDEFSEANNILHKWNHRKEIKKDPSRNSFFISSNYIKTNNYNLSFNDYKLIRQGLEIDKKEENSIPAETETIIAANKESLNEFFGTSSPLPPGKRRRRTAPIIVTLVILISGGAFYWFYLNGNFNNILSHNKITNPAAKINIARVAEDTERNSAGINSPLPDKIAPASVNNTPSDSAQGTPLKYTVITKTWFHSEADSASRKPFYLYPRSDLVLTPKEEKNGFVYVVYINSKGEATHGWLNKKDLQQVE